MDSADYIAVKTCTRCREDKHLAAFHRNRGQDDGRHQWCKECRSSLTKATLRAKNLALAEREALFAQGKQRCVTCKEVKALDDYYRARSKKRGRKGQCVSCYREVQAEYCARPEVVDARAAYSRSRRERDPEGYRLASRRTMLKTKYGITLEEYDNWLAKQDSKCAVCGRDAGDEVLVVDHDHDTGGVRGLLCHRCNSGIGMLGDSADGVARALKYLLGIIGPKTWAAPWTLLVT